MEIIFCDIPSHPPPIAVRNSLTNQFFQKKIMFLYIFKKTIGQAYIGISILVIPDHIHNFSSYYRLKLFGITVPLWPIDRQIYQYWKQVVKASPFYVHQIVFVCLLVYKCLKEAGLRKISWEIGWSKMVGSILHWKKEQNRITTRFNDYQSIFSLCFP